LLQDKLDRNFEGFKASAKDDCVVLTGESEDYAKSLKRANSRQKPIGFMA
jgi:CO dehydrogenase/acetyl-CoA synthase epsilon subunit